MTRPSQPQFARLLSEAISSVARRRSTTMRMVEWDLAARISEQEGLASPLTHHTVQRWMRGHPPNCRRMMAILEYCVRLGRISHDLAAGLLRCADCEHLLPELDKLYGQHLGPDARRVCSNLPRRTTGFRGREEEKANILQRLLPESRAAVVVIYGLGGVGKTTLAIEAGHACLPIGSGEVASPYDAVVFVSANYRALTLAEVLDEIGRVCEYPAILLRATAADKLPIAQDLLRRFQILVIIDSFEVISDPALARFAVEGVPAPSKVLLTTRDYQPTLWPGTWPIHLKGLSDSEARQLVREWAQDRHQAAVSRLSDDELEPLLRATDGNPYALLTALGLIANQQQPIASVFRDLWEGRGRIFDHIFGRAWATLQETHKHILMVMSFFAGSATRDAIGAAAGVDGFLLDTGLGHLIELSLVLPAMESGDAGQRFSVHPLTRNFVIARINAIPEFERPSRLRLSRYFCSYIDQISRRGKLGERYWGSLMSDESLRQLDPEWANLQSVLTWADHDNQQEVIVELVMRVVHYMDRRILYTERIRHVRRAAAAAHQLGFSEDEALLRIDGLGWPLLENGRLEEAENEINMGLQIGQSLADCAAANDLTALAYAFLARASLERKELVQAAALAKKALAIDCRPVIRYRAAFIAGDVALESGSYLEAIELYNTALRVSREYEEHNEGVELLCRLAKAHVILGDLPQAEAILSKIPSVESQGPITIEAIRAGFIRASMEHAKGNLESSYRLARQTYVVLVRLNPEQRLLEEIEDLLANLEEELPQDSEA